jgi:ACS family hexuronate transporter-like MFS transporter
MRMFKLDLLRARQTGMIVGAVLMIAPGCVALTGNAYAAMALLCIGGFAHQMISTTINTLTADLFPTTSVGTANGWVGCFGWAGGLMFSLLIGAVVGRTGYAPLFAALSVFDLMGAVILVALLRGMRVTEERQ